MTVPTRVIVQQAYRASRLHGARLGTLDEPEPLHKSASTVEQKIAHMLAAGSLGEQDIAGVEAAVKHQVDHHAYCISIHAAVPVRAHDEDALRDRSTLRHRGKVRDSHNTAHLRSMTTKLFLAGIVSLAAVAAHAATVPLFPSQTHPSGQGFVRVINHSNSDGEVSIRATDDSGMTVGAVILSIVANRTVHIEGVDDGNTTSEVSISLPGGLALTATAQDLESGDSAGWPSGAEIEGALGDGRGKWQFCQIFLSISVG